MNIAESEILHLYDLPEDVLIEIFRKCDYETIQTLMKTCKKFKKIILNEDTVFEEASKQVLMSNMSSPYFQKRCKPILNYRNRIIISKKWSHYRCKITKIVQYVKCMPFLALEKDYVFLSTGQTLQQYKRRNNGNVPLQASLQTLLFSDDISKFVTNDHEVVCAGRDGLIARLNKHNFNLIDCFLGHRSEVLCVDARNDIIISGCKRFSIKIWKASDNKTYQKAHYSLQNKVLSVAIMPSGSHFFVGSPGTRNVHPLQIFDIERCHHISNFGLQYRHGAGVLDIWPESFHTVLTCGYDSTVQLWDIRCPERSVSSWTEPFEHGLYNVQSDHNISILGGTACHASFLLWDKRVEDRPVRIYHTPMLDIPGRHRTTGYHTGPIYALVFDSTHVFIALEKTVFQYSCSGLIE